MDVTIGSLTVDRRALERGELVAALERELLRAGLGEHARPVALAIERELRER